MHKVMITSVDISHYSSPSVVVVECSTIEDAKQLANTLNDTKLLFQRAGKTIHRIAEVLDV